VIEQQLNIKTRSGEVETFVVHPERNGPYPVVLFYMDAPGIREELRDMARRMASVGYYVVLPNLYYRSGVMELGPMDRAPGSSYLTRMFELMNSLTITLVQEDTLDLLDWIDGQAAASKGPAGAVGYCMSGQHAMATAGNHPNRFKAAASIYGVALMTDKDDSPHLMARKAKAELYFACAEIDSWAPMDVVAALKSDLQAEKIAAEVEIFPKVEHGFAFPQRPAYDRDAAERHWERLFSLFGRNLTA
jgi:carboxymethylenebutenolidase